LLAAALAAVPAALAGAAGEPSNIVRVDGVPGKPPRALAGAGDVNGDGRPDIVIGVPSADPRRRYFAGSVYVVFGAATAGSVDLFRLGSHGYRIDGASRYSWTGASVASAGDVNGDGRADVLISADGGPTGRDAAYVVFGRAGGGTIDLERLGTRGFRIDGPTRRNGGAGLGPVAGAGDVNGDGRPDFLLGAGTAEGGRLRSGSAYVVFGSRTMKNIDLNRLGAGGFRIDGAAVGDSALGKAVAGAGDVNGDGRADVIIGFRYAANNARFSSGSAFVVFGKTDPAPVDLAVLGLRGFRIDGAAGRDEAGVAVARAGDVNGDGRGDVLVGAHGVSDAAPGSGVGSGAAYVVFGRTAGNVDLAALGAGGFRIAGGALERGETIGRAIAGPGDVNGDGRADLLLGAPRAAINGRPDSGSAYVVFGHAGSADVELGTLGTGGFRIDGAPDGGAAGAIVDGVGDLNADGRPEVLIGAPEVRARGPVYVVFGQNSTDSVDLASAADVRPPKLVLRGRTTQHVLRNQRVSIIASCDEACTLRASGSITFPRSKLQLPLEEVFPAPGNQLTATLWLYVTRRARARLTRAMRDGRHAVAKIRVSAVDRADNRTSAMRNIRLSP
jgi:hypothetical protein